MRIAILTTVYPTMIHQYYREHSVAAGLPFVEQREGFDTLISLWAGGWSRAFQRGGWETFTITINNRVLQRQWANEHGFQGTSPEAIAVEQIRRFKPDILWYDYFDSMLLSRIRAAVPSLRRVLGWTGSALVDETVLRNTDLVLSCAPEAVNRLRGEGLKAYHLNHAFDPVLLQELKPRSPIRDLAFVGQIFRGSELHRTREQLLLALTRTSSLTVFSPSMFLGPWDAVRSSMKKLAYYALKPFFSLQQFEAFIQRSPVLKEIRRARTAPWLPYNKRLQQFMSPPVYGTTMLESLRQSRIVLNIHADSSPEFASNMRLFETTGAGSCLLTDWKNNLGSLFEDGSEVVSYRTADECLERTSWLLAHPHEREDIARRGHERTLRDHTFDARIGHLLEIISPFI